MTIARKTAKVLLTHWTQLLACYLSPVVTFFLLELFSLTESPPELGFLLPFYLPLTAPHGLVFSAAITVLTDVIVLWPGLRELKYIVFAEWVLMSAPWALAGFLLEKFSGVYFLSYVVALSISQTVRYEQIKKALHRQS